MRVFVARDRLTARATDPFPPLAKGGAGGVDRAILSVLGHRSQSDSARAERSNSISEAAADTPPGPRSERGG